MEKFVRLNGVAASMPQPNIDTDAIILASYQRTLKDNPGKGLFAGKRYDLKGNEVPDFILNREPFRNSKIIVGGVNFGCGSSREFAVWALVRFGIKCVIAPSFGDIFLENSFKNGLLPIVLPEEQVRQLHQHLERANDPSMTVDLDRCVIELADGKSIAFTIAAARRTALLEGLDEIGQTLKFESDIREFQDRQRTTQAWIYDRPPSDAAVKGK